MQTHVSTHPNHDPPALQKSSTLDPRPSTLDPRPSTLDPRPSTLDPRPSTPDLCLQPQPSAPDPCRTCTRVCEALYSLCLSLSLEQEPSPVEVDEFDIEVADSQHGVEPVDHTMGPGVRERARVGKARA
eukprot:2362042-Rhodomonas_salina.1